MRGNGTKRAGYKLNIDTSRIEFWQDIFQLAVTDQWIAANERDVQRPKSINKIDHSLNEGVLFEIRKNAKGNAVAAEMCLVVGIAARAAKRALLCNFNGQQRFSTAEDGGPGLEEFLSLHVFPLKPAEAASSYSTVGDELQDRRGKSRKSLALLDAVFLEGKKDGPVQCCSPGLRDVPEQRQMEEKDIDEQERRGQ